MVDDKCCMFILCILMSVVFNFTRKCTRPRLIRERAL